MYPKVTGGGEAEAPPAYAPTGGVGGGAPPGYASAPPAYAPHSGGAPGGPAPVQYAQPVQAGVPGPQPVVYGAPGGQPVVYGQPPQTTVGAGAPQQRVVYAQQPVQQVVYQPQPVQPQRVVVVNTTTTTVQQPAQVIRNGVVGGVGAGGIAHATVRQNHPNGCLDCALGCMVACNRNGGGGGYYNRWGHYRRRQNCCAPCCWPCCGFIMFIIFLSISSSMLNNGYTYDNHTICTMVEAEEIDCQYESGDSYYDGSQYEYDWSVKCSSSLDFTDTKDCEASPSQEWYNGDEFDCYVNEDCTRGPSFTEPTGLKTSGWIMFFICLGFLGCFSQFCIAFNWGVRHNQFNPKNGCC